MVAEFLLMAAFVIFPAILAGSFVLHKRGRVSVLIRNIVFVISSVGTLLFTVAPAAVILLIASYRSPAPPPPEITRGEFPFMIAYEIDGVLHVIEDTLVAEFNRSVTGRIGKGAPRARRIWDTHFKSGGEGVFVIKSCGGIPTVEFGAGLAEYFMGDLSGGAPDPGRHHIWPQPSVSIRAVTETGGIVNIRGFIRPEDAVEILAEHGVVLVSWQYAEPLVNSFGR